MPTTSKTGTTRIAVVLDRSGSMGPLAPEVISGFNSWLKDTKKAFKGQQARISVLLFDNMVEHWVEDVPLSALGKLTSDTYAVRGMTALRDAFAGALVSLMAAKHGKQDKMICIITTDGMENASREWTTAELRKLIAKFEKAKGEIVYLGANQDAFAVGASYGLTAGQTVSTRSDQYGTRAIFATASSGMQSSAGGQSVNSGMTQAVYDSAFEAAKKDDDDKDKDKK